MGYDVYCAICGGPLGHVVFENDFDILEDDEMYDRNIVTSETTEWLSKVRVLGENDNSDSISKYAWHESSITAAS